jgi:hypothetical protein
VGVGIRWFADETNREGSFGTTKATSACLLGAGHFASRCDMCKGHAHSMPSDDRFVNNVTTDVALEISQICHLISTVYKVQVLHAYERPCAVHCLSLNAPLFFIYHIFEFILAQNE